MNIPPGRMTVKQMLAAAVGHHQAGRLGEAEGLYRAVLARDSANGDALRLLGVIRAGARDFDVALGLLDRAVVAEPREGAVHRDRANVLMELRRFADAAAGYERAIALEPRDPWTQVNLATALRSLGRLDDAIAAYRRAVELAPNMAEAHSYLGNALRDAGRLDEAIAAYEMGVKLSPQSAVMLSNLAVAVGEIGRKAEAIDLLSRAVQLDPRQSTVWTNLSDALRDVGRLADSAAAAGRAVELEPTRAEARVNLGNALMGQGRVEEALGQYQAAVTQRPDLHDAFSNAIYLLHTRVTEPAWLYDQHRAWERTYAARFSSQIGPHSNNRDPGRRLRIGYVSNDFRQHAVGRLFLPALEARSRENAEVICYAQSPRKDAMTERIRGASDGWRMIGAVSDDGVAEMVRADGIDILVDLGGHTAGNRLLVFARKPAPVQATWLGYPDTTGLAAIDYRIVDSMTDPAGVTDAFHSEKLVRIDPCFLCLRVEEQFENALAEGMNTSGFAFGCFNSFAKVSPETLRLWARVLSEAPAARLILKSRGLNEPGTVEFVRAALERNGVPLDRVEIRGHVEIAEHVRAYNDIDVALDPFPYSGTATTCDALSMGVPVVTLAGKSHVSRVSASLLSAAGLGEWVASDEASYVTIAVEAARRGPRAIADRVESREAVKRSALCDAAAFAGRLENAYRQMRAAWCGRGG